ncbi:MAG: GNAT family N-acetyltransferase [Gaiellaceae bacterium]
MTESPSTERLRAEPLSLAHEDELAVLHADERVMNATMGGTKDRTESREWIERNLRHGDEDGLGVFIFRDRETGRFAGLGLVRPLEVDGREEVEIGYVVAAELGGRGLATEMAEELVRFAGRSGLNDLVALTLPENAASRRVMEKAGFSYEREVEQPDETFVLYRRRSAP